MRKFTVEGTIKLQETESVILKTEAGHELFILFVDDKLTVCNESGKSDNRNLYIATIHDDGSISVKDDKTGDDLL